MSGHAAVSNSTAGVKRKRDSSSPTLSNDSTDRRRRSDARLTTFRADAVTDLAIDHLIHDGPAHPLHQRNMAQIVRRAIPTGPFNDAISMPFNRVHDLVKAKQYGRRARQVGGVERDLSVEIAKQALRQVGNKLSEVFELHNKGKSLQIQQDFHEYRLELTLKPILQLGDHEEEPVLSPQSKRDQDRQQASNAHSNHPPPLNEREQSSSSDESSGSGSDDIGRDDEDEERGQAGGGAQGDSSEVDGEGSSSDEDVDG